MPINMSGHIDSVFKTSVATRTPTDGSWVNGHWIATKDIISRHIVNVQPLSNKEIQTLQLGAERINDVRKFYMNDGSGAELKPSDMWTFDNVPGKFKVIALDWRPWHNYAKIIVSVQNDAQ